MRAIAVGIVLGSAVLAMGCLTQVSSLQPLFDADEAVALPELEGSWLEEEGSTVLTFRQIGPEYEMGITEDGKRENGRLRLRFGRLGDDVFWDLTAQPSEHEGLWGEHRLPVHSFARVRLEDDRLEVAFLNPDWLEKAMAEGRLEPGHEGLRDLILLTVPTPELQRLLLENAYEEEFLSSAAVFRRQTVE
ncbi:MAG: hypothetical protein HY317_01105 [Acidobacteria bacterium]|nr:hypothetical protein [Acidobacteriota bacterium]